MTDKETPTFTCPKIDTEEDNRENDRTENADPIVNRSRTENVFPNLTRPLIDKLDPRSTVSITDSFCTDPTAHKPLMDSEEPILQSDRKDRVEPICTKSVIDM